MPIHYVTLLNDDETWTESTGTRILVLDAAAFQQLQDGDKRPPVQEAFDLTNPSHLRALANRLEEEQHSRYAALFRDRHELVQEDVRVSLEWVGEGWFGDYDPTDNEDEKLYRFEVERLVDGEWEVVDDASYCTKLSVDRLTGEEAQTVLREIMNVVRDSVRLEVSIKKACERLSWIDPDGVCRADVPPVP